MKILVAGGNGLIGKKLAGILAGDGHEVVPASRSTGVDLLTGDGLEALISGTQVVVDVLNSPSFEDGPVMEFFTTTSRNLLAAASEAGITHYVALSVVGVDRISSGYFRAKLAQEQLIEASGLPYTIVRATQFFEFAAAIGQFSMVNDEARLPPAPTQPIAADDVAACLASVATAQPANAVVELAGPERIPLDELARRGLAAVGDSRKVVTDPEAIYFGAKLDVQGLAPGENPRTGPLTFSEWLTRGGK
jgi:uncharacterized protein YbjT (DUF2867 family)